MTKKELYIFISVMVLVSGVCIVMLIMQMHKGRIPPEKIPPPNNFDTADMIIALVVDSTEVYQFILSNGNELEVSCGYGKPDYGYDIICGVVTPREGDFIKSIDFLQTVEMRGSIVVREEDYEKMLSLGNQIIDEKPGRLWNSTGGTNIAIFRPDAKYEMNYLYVLPETKDSKEGELVVMLEEYSPIVISYKLTHGIFTEKSLGD